MSMNVLKIPNGRYQWRRLRIFRTVFRNLKYAWQRITKGYCDMDVWNLYDWFLQIMPRMLTQLAMNAHGYPANFNSYDEWQQWLLDKAEALSSCREDESNWNIYEQEYMAHINDEDNETARAITRKYFDEEKRLAEEQQDLLENTFIDLSKHFYGLWD